jgi:monoamine oxidase
VLTLRDPRLGVALELGAEFVHGEAPETSRVVRAGGLMLCNVAGEHWRSSGSRLRDAGGELRRIDAVFERFRNGRGHADMSFSEFIATRPGGRAQAAARTLALEFVRGFHAADPERISTRALAEGGSVTDQLRTTARVVEGQDRIVEWMAVPLGGAVRLETVVKRVAWGENGVTVEAITPGEGTGRYRARAAIVTVPHSVLRASPGAWSGIVFAPELPLRTRNAIASLETGSALRITMVLRERVWEDTSLPGLPRGRRLDHMSFMHTRGAEFNVWWTLFPLVDRVIVGWSGGPPARDLAARGRAVIEDTAISELALALGIQRTRLEALLETCVHHDWDADPFSLGAYSHPTPGAADAPAHLAQPLAGVLHFAGEAADPEGRNGTVEGAIGSGRRAALAVLSSFRS